MSKPKIDPSKVFYSLCYADILEIAKELLADGAIKRKPNLSEVERIAHIVENAITWYATVDIAIQEVMNQ